MPQSRVFAILALIITINSSMAEINYEIFANDEHPNKCVINTAKGQTIIDSLESIQHPTKCARIECGKNGWALIYTCLNSDPPEECIGVPYPGCCEMSDECNFI